MRLFIAEKPSLARAIADVLPGPHKRAANHIECGDGNTVAWCAGHILETAPPEAYSPDYKTWRLEHLPIVPKDWKLEVSTPPLVKSLRALLKRAQRVVHAGDPDREGQLLVDEVLVFVGYKGPVDRILISDLSPDAVRRALSELQPNARYRGLYESALARQRADWLFGMNMTRLYTLLGRGAGHEGVLSVGRVQTPVLGLIVRRDLAIEQFRPTPYFVVTANLETPGGEIFSASWSPGPTCALDEDKRVVDRDVAEQVRARTDRQTGAVVGATQDPKTEAPPLPYSLADIQMDAARRLGLSAQAVLEACQSLYETHRLTTYPRSDCSYLPEGHLAQTSKVIRAITAHAPSLAKLTAAADLGLRSRAWNDKKITAHHAIIPTPNAETIGSLSEAERGVYELVCRRYLSQFYPAHEYLQTKVEVAVAGETFVAHGRQVVALGWKALSADIEADSSPEPDPPGLLPALRVGDPITAAEVTVAEKHTEPPKAFSDASLIQAMCNVARFVGDPSVKKILAETDGIGTPATRASIIEILLERGYTTRVKKTIRATPTGRALIQSLPPVATTPEMTAVWEAAMRAIHDGEQTLDVFLTRVIAQLTQLIDQGRKRGPIALPPTSSGERGKPARVGDGKKTPRSKQGARTPY